MDMSAIPSAHASPPVRVLIVDDSVVARGLLSRWVGQAHGFTVVATARNGRVALELAKALDPDIVLLDLDMPELDGLATLPRLLADHPGLSVLIVSTLGERSAEMSVECLRLGALDVLAKPRTSRELTIGTEFPAALMAKLEGFAQRNRRREACPQPDEAFPSRSATVVTPRVVVIGASTGGPQAVTDVIKGLVGVSRRVPILVVQHMPAIFTTIFARQIEAYSGIRTREGRDGEAVEAATVYVAPGGWHMGLDAAAARPTLRLLDGAVPHGARPALDILLTDAAVVYGRAALAAVLTGMGTDGLVGARALVEAGGTVLAQDEATSVVWGMSGSIVQAGLAASVLPLSRIAPAIEARVLGSPVPYAMAAGGGA